ncbi:MAG: hypothetical protein QXW10_04125 [Candidatus Micrarchaeaceae archaeon]
MGRRSKASALMQKARSDFAMAESYLKSRDYAAASAAYLSVIKEVLSTMSKGRPTDKKVAEEIEEEVLIPVYVTSAAEGDYTTYYSSKQGFGAVEKAPNMGSTMEKRDAAKRLMDYVLAYAQRA